MSINSILAIANENTTTVLISFSNKAEKYTYRCDKCVASQLERGDAVVVTSSTGYTIGTVSEVHEESEISRDSTLDYEWVVSKIDPKIIYAHKEREDTMRKQHAAAERRKIREAITHEYGFADNIIDAQPQASPKSSSN
jgi:hypothetical protein